MWKLIRAGLWSRKLRLFTTALAVALGVAFTTGTLVLTDTIGKVFDELFDQITEGTDSLITVNRSVRVTVVVNPTDYSAPPWTDTVATGPRHCCRTSPIIPTSPPGS